MNFRFKKVSFNNTESVLYIENINILKDILWWNSNDYIEAEKNAWLEINNLRSLHSKMTLNEAKILLYQPNNISYFNPDFF